LTKTEILKTDQRDLTRPDTSEKSKRVEIENELKDQKRLKRAKVGTKREPKKQKILFKSALKKEKFSIFNFQRERVASGKEK